MASSVNALFCALAAVAFWSLLGHALARRLLPRPLVAGAAPVIGWAVHSAAALPLFFLIGFNRITVLTVAAACAVAAVLALRLRRIDREVPQQAPIPPWGYVAAAVLALMPAAAILPKFAAGGVHLAEPIYDHAKIAIIDAMTRQGLPPINPVFGTSAAPGHLAYYYLWHFGAAELALALGGSGWEADAGLTWFTAFASLCLMMGVAVWLARRSSAAVVVVLLAAAASMRNTLWFVSGSYDLTPLLAPPTGFAGWMFQSAWVPQHLMAASCVVTAMLLVARYGQARSVAVLLTLVLLVVAGFESSTYVGGVTFAIGAVIAAPVLLLTLAPDRRLGFTFGLAVAAVLAVGLAVPFMLDQLGTVAARGGGNPIHLHPFEVVGTLFAPAVARLLDLPAYWLILLPLEFPAAYVAGVLGLAALLRGRLAEPERLAVAALASLAVAGLSVSWLVVGTLGEVNDLGLRAVLPAELVLVIAAAAGVMMRPRRPLIIAAALVGFVVGVPDTVHLAAEDFIGHTQPDDAAFAQAPELWAAVRRHAPPTARVANNPLYLQDLTPWPVNMTWALLADRSSCFAGKEMALAFAPLPEARRDAIAAQFQRVFDGKAGSQDVSALARLYGCDVIAIVPQDGAWSNDPFAASADYRLAENRDGRWRIYTRVAP